jgi:hypothetical protein
MGVKYVFKYAAPYLDTGLNFNWSAEYINKIIQASFLYYW